MTGSRMRFLLRESLRPIYFQSVTAPCVASFRALSEAQCLQPIAQAFDDAGLLLPRELRMQWKRQRALIIGFGLGAVPVAKAERAVIGLRVDRDVVDVHADPVLAQHVKEAQAQRGAIRQRRIKLHRIEMQRRALRRVTLLQAQGQVFKRLVISPGAVMALFDEAAQTLDLAGAKRGLQVRHAIVQAQVELLVIPGAVGVTGHAAGIAGDAVTSKHLKAVRQRIVARGDDAAFCGGDDLDRVKGKHAGIRIAAIADRGAVITGADRVRGVFDDAKAIFIGQRMSQDCPPKCTGMTIWGNVPSRRACSSLSLRCVARRFRVAGSISTKSTSAPQSRPALAEATKLLGDVQRRLPGPSPSPRQAICSAEVALLTAMAWGALQVARRACSKRGTAGPWVRKSERSTSTTAATSSSLIDWRP